MTLESLQQAVCDALTAHEAKCGNAVRVIAEDAGNVIFERDSAIAQKHMVVIVGSPRFTPTSRDSARIVGNAALDVIVYEQPTRNRVGQRVDGPSALAEAESIALRLHLLPFDGGVIVFTRIGGVERVDEKTIARTISFETITTLTGE